MKGTYSLTLLFLVLFGSAYARRIPFTLISDVHYDPNYGTSSAYGLCTSSTAAPMGQKGCDAPLALVRSAFEDMAAAARNDSYLLFTGDWLRHGISMGEAEATFWNLTQFISGLPHITIPAPSFSIASLGNNDFIPDYYFDLDNPPTTVAGFGNLLKEANLINESESVVFSKAAYYAKDVTALNLRFLILNTLLYSISLEPVVDPSTVPDPAGQFAWMETQLRDAQSKGTSVVVMSHIPPTMNSFSCAYGNFQSYVQEQYLVRLQSIFQAYNDTIVFMFFGHTHQMNWLADDGFGVPGLVIPGITKIFGNMASYLTAEYDDELKTFLNFKMRHLTMSGDAWVDYIGPNGEVFLDQILGPLSSLEQARATAVSLMTDADLWDRFSIVHAGGVDFNVWPGIPVDATLRIRHSCSILAFSNQGYDACIQKYSPLVSSTSAPTTTSQPTDAPDQNNLSAGMIVLIAASSVIGIAVFVGLLLFLRKQYGLMKAEVSVEVPLKTAHGSYLTDHCPEVN